MKLLVTYITSTLLCLTLSTFASTANSKLLPSPNKGYLRTEWVEYEGERIVMVHLLPVVCFSRKADMRRYARLVDAVKRVYPIAKLAHEKMVDLERELLQLPNKKSQKEYTKDIYRQLLEEYTPVMRRMTQTQGRVLLRLIDRQTDYTAYEVVNEFRGAFVASFWQGIGRLFGQDLKSEYGQSQEDQIIEQIITYYESGLL